MLALTFNVGDMLVITDADGDQVVVRIRDVSKNAHRVRVLIGGPKKFSFTRWKKDQIAGTSEKSG